jgi:hypothetical protein
MKVFIVLQWFYEGDSNLVDSFMGVKLTYKEAKSLLDKDDTILKEEEFEVYDGERKPKEWGSYGYGSKYEIREVKL